MINEKNNFLTVSWLSGLLSAEIFISTGEWGVQMPPLTSENSYFLRSGPQGATLVMQGVVSCNLYWLHARHFQQLCNSRLNCDLYRHGTVTSQPFPCLTDCESGHMHGTGINITKYFEVDKFLSCRKLLWEYNIAQMWAFPHDIFAMLSLWYLYLRYDKYALLMSHRIMLHCRKLFVRRIFLCTTLPFLLTALNQNGLFSMYYMFICFSYFVQTLFIYFDSRGCVFKLGSSLCMLCNCISW